MYSESDGTFPRYHPSARPPTLSTPTLSTTPMHSLCFTGALRYYNGVQLALSAAQMRAATQLQVRVRAP